MTAQLSRERLEKIAAWEIEITDAGTRHAPGAHSKVYSYEIVEMARMLLAGTDSEPLAYFYPGDETEWQGVALAEELDDEQKARCIPLYASPPAPVAVPSGYRLQPISEYDAMCAAMLKAGPVTGWIKCSERMPDADGNYWGWWSQSKRQGPVWFIKSDLQAKFQSSEITHWMPLPAAPEQEV